MWYDGAQREREDALARITSDLHAFLHAQVEAFASSCVAWEELVARAIGGALFHGTDGLDANALDAAPTIAWTARVAFRSDRVLVVSVDPRWFPKRREAIALALAKTPWCASVSVGPQIEVTVRTLDANAKQTAARTIGLVAARFREDVRKGANAFLAIMQPDSPPSLTCALTETLAKIDVLESEKVAELVVDRP